MPLTLNSKAYRQLIQEDIDWLLTVPRTLERDHILHILRHEHEHAEERITREIEKAHKVIEEPQQPEAAELVKTNGVTLATIERMIVEQGWATPKLGAVDRTSYVMAVRLCERAYAARLPGKELFDNVLIGLSLIHI